MKKNKTHVVIVLDRSTSMGSIRKQAVDGYNEQISQLKLDAKDPETGQVDVSLITFHSTVTEHLWRQPVEETQQAAPEDYITEGMTALHDAIGHGITKMQQDVQDDDDTAYLFVIISDGQENSSKKFSAGAIKELIESCEKTGRWTFTYMGCDKLELERVSRDLGFKMDNMAAWENTSRGTRVAMNMTRGKLSSYMDSRKLGIVKAQGFHSDELGAVANYVDIPDQDAIAGDQPVGGDIFAANNTSAGDSADQPEVSTTVATTGVFKSGKTITWQE